MSEEPGLRERKKTERYRALAVAARDLTMERGLEAVSVEEIAAAAGVSIRTFHNYFSCKEEAIIGVEPTGLADLGAALAERPAHEAPFEALQALLMPDTDRLDDVAGQWLVRTELVRRYPTLLPRYLAGLARVEEVLTVALAERMGIDPDRDPTPRVAVASMAAVLRTTLRWWHEGQPSMSLADALQANFEMLRAGLGATFEVRCDTAAVVPGDPVGVGPGLASGDGTPRGASAERIP